MENNYTLHCLVIFGLFGTILSCSTKNDYHYNVVDCKDAHISALGDYILAKLKNTRDLKSDTCNTENMSFLRRAPFKHKDNDYDAAKLSAVWIYKDGNEPGTTFSGAAETLEALKNEATWNILVDKKYSVQRFVLRNSTDGSITVSYLSDEDLMSKLANQMYWEHVDIIECENFLYYLSKEFKNQLISFTPVDRFNSNWELRFIVKSQGIGGFYKKTE